MEARKRAVSRKLIRDDGYVEKPVAVGIVGGDNNTVCQAAHPVRQDLDQRPSADVQQGFVGAHPAALPSRQYNYADITEIHIKKLT